jgi:GNAT superfamily N-acetyltransferase
MNGEIVGMVGLLTDPLSDGSSAVVEPVVVTKEHRGNGIGKMLLEFIKGEAKKMGATFLSIQPVARNVAAMKMFHKMGFKAVGNVDMVIELQDEKKIAWKPGLELHGLELDY